MANFSVTDAVGSGPGLIARHPLAVLAWGLLVAAVMIPILLLFGATIIGIIAQFAHAAAGSPPVAAILSSLGVILLFVLVVSLVGWVVGAVITAAVFRAVLHPEQSAFAYLRFGAEEWSLMLTNLVLFLVFFGVGIALAIPTSVITLSTIGSPESVRLSVSLLVTLARYAVTIWIWVRLCMALPMTFAERRFRVFESWTMTRGHTAPLIGVGVLAFLILGVIELVAGILGLSSLALVGGAVDAMRANPQAMLAQPQTLLATFAPVLVIWAVLYALVTGLANAILRAPVAYIYRELSSPDVAATFS